MAGLHQQPPQQPARPLLRPQRGFPALPPAQARFLGAAARRLQLRDNMLTTQEAAATNSMLWQMLLRMAPRTSLLLVAVGSWTTLWQAQLTPLGAVRSSPSNLQTLLPEARSKRLLQAPLLRADRSRPQPRGTRLLAARTQKGSRAGDHRARRPQRNARRPQGKTSLRKCGGFAMRCVCTSAAVLAVHGRLILYYITVLPGWGWRWVFVGGGLNRKKACGHQLCLTAVFATELLRLTLLSA